MRLLLAAGLVLAGLLAAPAAAGDPVACVGETFGPPGGGEYPYDPAPGEMQRRLLSAPARYVSCVTR